MESKLLEFRIKERKTSLCCHVRGLGQYVKILLTGNSKSDVMPGARRDVGVGHQVSLSPVIRLRHVHHSAFPYLHRTHEIYLRLHLVLGLQVLLFLLQLTLHILCMYKVP